MRYEDILQILRDYKDEKGIELGILKLGLFGSAARREHRGQSDIDVVVDLKEQDLFSLIGLKEDLESRLHSSVDVVSYRPGMNPVLKNHIDRDVKYV